MVTSARLTMLCKAGARECNISRTLAQSISPLGADGKATFGCVGFARRLVAWEWVELGHQTLQQLADDECWCRWRLRRRWLRGCAEAARATDDR